MKSTTTDVNVESGDGKYKFTKDMNEISGFGGGYEAACRRMVLAGVQWLDAHPEADPQFHGYKGVYGVVTEDNQDAKDLTEAVVAGSGGDCTGAMHQAAISHVLFIKRNGWDKYVAELTHPQGEAGILRDKLKETEERLEKVMAQREAAANESINRGFIIAEKVLGWDTYPVSQLNDVQKVYAPSKEAAASLRPGDSLYRFVDEAIKKMRH